MGNLRGTKALIFDGNQVVDTIRISSSGKYEYEFEFNKNYKIQFSSNGFVTQTIRLNTNVSQKVMERNDEFPPFQFDPVLFKELPSMDYYMFDGPLVTLAYNERIDHFEYDYDFYDDFVVETKKENRKAQKLAEKDASANAEQLAKDKSYQKAVENADRQFDGKNYAKAKTFYEQALIFKPDQQYPKDKLTEIEGVFAEEKRKEEEALAFENQYKAVIAEADSYYKQKNFSEAKAKYQQALGMKPNEEYPKYKIEDIETIVILIEKDNQYQEVITQADEQLASKDYDNAKRSYSKASEIKPREAYPKKQIAEIERLVSELAKAEAAEKLRNENYQAAIAKADQEFSDEQYAAAKSSYQEASSIKPTEAYPKDQVSKIDGILSDLAKAEAEAKAQDAAYNKAIATADKAFGKEEYDLAKASYQEASTVKPEETYPKDQLSKIDGILSDLAAKKAEQEKLDSDYQNLIAQADADFNSKSYGPAKSSYQQASQLKPSEKYPQERVKEIDRLLQELADKEAAEKLRNENYQAAIAKADQEFSDEQYAAAKSSYQEASSIKPTEAYPKDQVSKIDGILSDLAKAEAEAKAQDAAYNKAIATADKAFGKEEYDLAKASYQEASTVKPEETYPKDQLSKIDGILSDLAAKKAEQEKLESDYQNLIAQADADFNSKSYGPAKSSYLQASQLKPSEKYPQERVKEIDRLLQELADKEAAEKLRNENYQAAIAKADQEFSVEQYGVARKGYQEASGIKPTEAYPKDQVSKIDGILSDLAKAEAEAKAQDAAYNKAIATADKAFGKEEYDLAKASYQEASTVKPEETYPKDQLSKIDGILSDLAAKNAEQEMLDSDYQNLIAQADADFNSKSYGTAKSSYQQASQLKPSEKYPQERVKEIDRLLQELADKEAAEKLRNENYQAAIAKADQEFSVEQYGVARKGYQEASGIKPTEAYPKDQVSKIDGILSDLAKAEAEAKAQDAAYNKAIATADKAFGKEEYDLAKASYQEASTVKPEETYPKDQLSKIDGILSDLAAKNAEQEMLDSDYQNLIAQADADFNSKSYGPAKSSYQQASQLKPSEKYPQERVKEIDRLLQELADKEAAEKLRNENYQAAIAKADQEFSVEQYAAAKSSYQEASSIKPTEAYPKDQVSKIDGILSDLAKAEAEAKAQDAAYNNAIATADKAFGKEEYDLAKASYQEASTVKPEETYPKDQLSKIDGILSDLAAKKAEQEKLDSDYQNLIAQADADFNSKSYGPAKLSYQQASQLMPSEKYPQERVKEIDRLLQELADKEAAEKLRNENYQAAIAKADQEFSVEQYGVARKGYQEASGIKPEESYPQQQISKIDQILADREKSESDRKATQKAYDDAIALADKAFKKENYEPAKSSYQEASSLKPAEVYPQEQISKIDQILADLAKKAADKNKLESDYQNLIAQADADFNSKSYGPAKSSYQQASQLKPSEKYPQERVKEIDRLLQELADKEAAEKLRNENYQAAIAKADQEFSAEQYGVARKGYQDASGIKPEESYPQQQISKIDQILADREKSESDRKATQKAYDDAIALADKAFKKENYEPAKSSYQEASSLKPAEVYPQEQISKIDQILADLAKKAADKNKLESDYQNLIAQADADFNSKSYGPAKSSYQQASQLKPSEKYPQERVKEIDRLLQELADKEAAEKLRNENYQAAIAKADQEFSVEQYAAAKSSYQEASGIKPEESYPQQQISKIDQILADREKSESDRKATQKAYDDAIALADKAFKKENYEPAKSSYQEASSLKPAEVYPQEQISKIDQILADLAKKAADKNKLESDYQNLIVQADADFNSKSYGPAKSSYQQASQLKPSEKYPQERVKEIDRLLQELADKEAAEKLRNENYQAAIAKADQEFSVEQYAAAKSSYQEASGIKPEESYPQQQISKIDQILADREKSESDRKATQKAYDDAIALADKAFKKENYEPAKSSYQEASSLKPAEVYPQEQISKIDQILADLAKKAADKNKLESDYQNLIAQADADFNNKNYETAKTTYQQASQLKPKEKYPPERIAEIDRLLNQQVEAAKQRDIDRERYNKIIANADALFKKESLEAAKSEYGFAQKIFPTEPYPAEMIAKIDGLLQVAANKERLLALEKKYNLAIGRADKLFRAKQWHLAKDNYTKATEIKPNEQYPRAQLAEIERILNQVLADQKQAKDESEYKRLINQADKAFDDYEYASALSAYVAASDLFPSRQYPKDQAVALREIMAKLDVEDQQHEREELYREFIRTADNTFKRGEYVESRNAYLSASHIKPTNPYPTDQIAKIDEIVQNKKDQAEETAKLNAAYNNAIEIADFQFNSQQYDASRKDYEKALSYKPNESYPKEQIEKIVDIQNNRKKRDRQDLATKDAYEKALERGGQALSHDEFTVARFYFNQAKTIRSYETLPDKRLADVDVAQEKFMQAALDREFNGHIATGDEHLTNEAFVAARFFYTKAKNLKPQDELPLNRLKAVDLAEERKKYGDVKAKCLEIVREADVYFAEEDFSVAEYFYEMALEVKGDEEYPVKKLEEIASIKSELAEDERLNAYLQAIDRADRYYTKADYSAARYFYKKALEYDKEAKHPKERLEFIDHIYDPEYLAQVAAFNNAIEKADRAFKHKDYELSRTWYQKALKIRETDDHARKRLKEIDVLTKGTPKAKG